MDYTMNIYLIWELKINSREKKYFNKTKKGGTRGRGTVFLVWVFDFICLLGFLIIRGVLVSCR